MNEQMQSKLDTKKMFNFNRDEHAAESWLY